MSELRPCPFCGSEAITTTFIDPDDFEYMPIEVNDCDAEVTCENERCINGWYLSPKAWNTRPIEDALNNRIAELEAEKCVLIDQQREAKNILIDKNLHIDSLYEEGYKLQQRIAELEADNAELKERVAMLDITAVYKSLGEMGHIEQVTTLNARIAELEAAQRWIPVSERLPEVDQEVLVFDQRGDITIDYLVALNRDGDAYYTNADDGALFWMPLPQPPEVQE